LPPLYFWVGVSGNWISSLWSQAIFHQNWSKYLQIFTFQVSLADDKVINILNFMHSENVKQYNGCEKYVQSFQFCYNNRLITGVEDVKFSMLWTQLVNLFINFYLIYIRSYLPIRTGIESSFCSCTTLVSYIRYLLLLIC
jgi:hypothetical protein